MMAARSCSAYASALRGADEDTLAGPGSICYSLATNRGAGSPEPSFHDRAVVAELVDAQR